MNTRTARNSKLRLLIAALLLACLSEQASALISGSLVCSVTGYNTYGYEVSPGAEFEIPFSGTCTAKRAYPRYAATNLEITPVYNVTAGAIKVLQKKSYMYMSEIPLGSYGPDCLGETCMPLRVGATVSYTYYIVGRAPQSGSGRAIVKLGVTSAGYPNYAEWLHEINFIYRVRSETCSLTSARSISLKFDPTTPAGLAGQQKSAPISLNCTGARPASMTLTANQPIVNAASGVSKTSLTGVNMQALWSASMTPASFNTPRAVTLKQGTNDIGLTFSPQVVNGADVSGSFQVQYTLTVNYQ
ncbi:fimbrial protein [Pseudomonas sp. SC11]|uniref:fimbrial protein n=2 Tax=Pseudomonas TaxID=286 RepID=UPI003999FE13